MVKDLKSFSEEQNKQMFLTGISYAMYDASLDKEVYEKYKHGCTKDLKEEQLKDAEILFLLEKLGYPMNELGTYLYKDVVLEVMDLLKDISILHEPDKCEQLLSELNNAYSQFYLNVAREDKEMGLKTFHWYLGESISKIDVEATDKEVAKSVYGDCDKDLNYGLVAFKVASYALNKIPYESVEEYQNPNIKKLPNMSNVNVKVSY